MSPSLRFLSFSACIFAVFAAEALAQTPNDLIWVEGGGFKNIKSAYYGKNLSPSAFVGKPLAVPGFYIGKYEVTQKQWVEVMGSNPSKYEGDRLPVESVSWYDCIVYCNKRSAKEGLVPYYIIDDKTKDENNKNPIDNIKWTVTINPRSKGYRLPTEVEWEYAAEGGQQSKNYTYSGSDDIEKVAWFFANSGDKPLSGFWSWPIIEQNHNKSKPVGSKAANELGLYDMSGNVREWCWNWYGESASPGLGPVANDFGRVWRGGGWLGGDFCSASNFRGSFEASGKGPDQGLRVCRDK